MGGWVGEILSQVGDLYTHPSERKISSPCIFMTLLIVLLDDMRFLRGIDLGLALWGGRY